VNTKKKISALSVWEWVWGYGFLAPWILGFLLFTAGPMLASLVLSFTDYNPVGTDAPKFIGLENWLAIFKDPTVQKSIYVTVNYVLISTPILIAVPLLMAVLLNAKALPVKSIFRTLFYLPAMIPGVAATMCWMYILNPKTGWINQILGSLGIPGPDWMNSPQYAPIMFVLLVMWGVGPGMMIFLAALQGVPTELYEAARVDGATPLRSFFSITLPMISPVLFYNLVIGLIGGLRYFMATYIVYQGTAGPDGVAQFYMLTLYRNAFVFYRMGYASALAWLLFLVGMVLTVLLFVTAKRWVYYAGSSEA